MLSHTIKCKLCSVSLMGASVLYNISSEGIRLCDSALDQNHGFNILRSMTGYVLGYAVHVLKETFNYAPWL